MLNWKLTNSCRSPADSTALRTPAFRHLAKITEAFIAQPCSLSRRSPNITWVSDATIWVAWLRIPPRQDGKIARMTAAPHRAVFAATREYVVVSAADRPTD